MNSVDNKSNQTDFQLARLLQLGAFRWEKNLISLAEMLKNGFWVSNLYFFVTTEAR